MVFVAVAAMGLTACQNDIDEQVEVKESVTINFVADSAESRTSVDTSGDKPVFVWGEGESFAVLEQTTYLAEATNVTYENVDSKAHITATFANNAGKEEYNYVTIYPESGYVNAESIESATLTLPAEQTMAEGSYDPTADLMVSEVVTTAAQPTEAQLVRFSRIAAVAKMSFKDFGLESGDHVEKVIFAVDGKTIAGNISLDLNNPEAFTADEEKGSSSVSIATTSESDVYFTLLPTTLEAGNTYTITIITNNRLYIKQGAIPDGKSLQFQAGKVTRFGVDMAGVVPSEKWVLVEDASTLQQGDIVAIATKNFNYVMGAAYSGSTYPYASYTPVVKAGDYLYHPVTPGGTTSGNNVIQQLTLVQRDNTKVAFDFYNGVDYDGDTKVGYLYTQGTNKQVRLQDYPDNNSLFYITITDGVAKIVANDSEFSTKYLQYFIYSSGNKETYRRFGCVNESTYDDEYAVCIYKIEGAVGTVPVADATIVVPDKDEYVVLEKEAVESATAIEEVEFTYVGDWNIEVTSNADWLTPIYADGTLTYTAEANTDSVRYAVVTITASLAGKEDITWTFNVLQKGAPLKVSIEEFIEKEVDENVQYMVTGVLSSKSTSSTSNTTLVDAEGNEADFRYLEMADGTSFYNNNNIKVGDVVTIVASVSYSGRGGSSSSPAICQGYYNIAATVEDDLVANTGGEVKITIAKTGTLEPGTITASISDTFAKLDYTEDADKATVTFTANSDAPRQAIVTFTDGYATAEVVLIQSGDESKGSTWELVTDASTLREGDKVIIAAAEYDVAMSTTVESKRRNDIAVTKLGNYYLTPTVGTQILVLINGSDEGKFAFYDEEAEAFLASTNETSYYLENQSYIDANTSFEISITNGATAIENKGGNFPDNVLNYRTTYSYNYFYSGTTTQQAICLYRLAGVAEPVVPVIPASITVPEEDIVIPEERAATATAISDIVVNYVGGWNIAVSDDAEWLSVYYDDGVFSYTAEANSGTVRNATISITASLAGEEDITWTFGVLQKGEAAEISIAEFITKPINADVEYKITGVITSLASSYSGYTEISDGNGNIAKVRYIKTESDAWMVNEDIVEVGDVITVVAAVTTTIGCGGHSSTPAIYKGHYNLSAEASSTLVGYEGGEVTITLSKGGNLLPEGAVIKGVKDEASDFATLSYTDDATSATISFVENAGSSREATMTFTYGLAETTVTIAQQNHPSVKVGWFLVTDASELQLGDKVIIAALNSDYALNAASATTSSTTLSSASITKIGDCLSDGSDGVTQFTLEEGSEDGEFSFTYLKGTTEYYLCAPNTNDQLKIKNGALEYYGSWTITIDSSTGKASVDTIYGTTTPTPKRMMYNATSTKFATCKKENDEVSPRAPICLYKYYE